MISSTKHKRILVYAHWAELKAPLEMGVLHTNWSRGKEIFSFEYNQEWLQSEHALVLDPELGLYSGPQYVHDEKVNFGLFLDSSPDRWGRLLMRRKEAALARGEGRDPESLYESDYLLRVYDGTRMGGIRLKTDPDGPFLDDDNRLATPPWTSLRDLEYASLQLENSDAADDPEYHSWLNILLAPGSSLGGARPKASIVDPDGHLWIAKFPSVADMHNTGAWEMTTNQMARMAGLQVAESQSRKFSGRHSTFLTKRFDRTNDGRRIHYASALTMLGYQDGTDHHDGASYLELAGFIMRFGSQVDQDLEELWRRIVFFISVSNTDDHLRNHGFIYSSKGWKLSPAFDMNPVETGTGLSLNISETDNTLNIDLALEVAEYFRLSKSRSEEILTQVRSSVKKWREIAARNGISNAEQTIMANAFSRA